MHRTLATWTVTLTLLAGCAAPVEPEVGAFDEPPADATELSADTTESTPALLPEVAQDELLPHGLHFVIVGHEQAFIVLGSSPEPLASGPIELVSDPNDAASSEVHTFRPSLEDEPEREGERRTEALAERFVLFGHAGELCRIQADDLGELRRAGFEASYAWRENGAGGAASREEAWELGRDGALSVARVGALPGACRGAVWAQRERSGAPRVFAADTRSDPALAARALASFRELPEYQATQSEYSEPDPDSELPARPRGPWDEYDGARPTTRLFRHDATGRRLVVVSAAAGSGCGDFGASLWALFEQRAGRLVLHAVERDASPPTDVVDADGDGTLELFTGEHASFVSEGERLHVDVSVPFNGCGC